MLRRSVASFSRHCDVGSDVLEGWRWLLQMTRASSAERRSRGTSLGIRLDLRGMSGVLPSLMVSRPPHKPENTGPAWGGPPGHGGLLKSAGRPARTERHTGRYHRSFERKGPKINMEPRKHSETPESTERAAWVIDAQPPGETPYATSPEGLRRVQQGDER